jgi:hypothetical protein
MVGNMLRGCKNLMFLCTYIIDQVVDASNSLNVSMASGAGSAADHGGLVRKILETNKSFAGDDAAKATADTQTQHSRAKERALLKKEVDRT